MLYSVRCFIIALFFSSPVASASSYLVLGAIGSDMHATGVVLLKKRDNDKAFAVKVGSEVEKGITVFKINDRYVYFKNQNEMIRVKIGEDLEQANTSIDVVTMPSKGEIEVRGDRVTLSAKYKDHLVKNDLTKILMQAAAIPVYQNGRLEGFKIVDIEPASIYEQVGLKNGDIITEINSQKLSDVGMAVKVLNSLRNDVFAEVRLLRAGTEKTIEINVQ
jgi:general secretion pathway protein C